MAQSTPSAWSMERGLPLASVGLGVTWKYGLSLFVWYLEFSVKEYSKFFCRRFVKYENVIPLFPSKPPH